MLSRSRFAVAILPLLCLLSLPHAGAQTPVAPPMVVQVPFISVGAGNIVSGLSSSSKAAACTGYANASGSNYGDGCAANQVGVSTPWGVAVDRWGNVYFSDEGHTYVRVIYAGATTVDGMSNPATAMIPVANTSLGISTPLVAGDVYALAGGLTSGTVTTCNGGGTALSADGSGCPATDSLIKGPYSPAVDSAGNVFIPDKSNSLAYVVLANSTGLAAKLVATENASSFPNCLTNFPTSCTGAVPQVGYIYQVVGKGGGYVDGVIANNSGEIHAPYGIAVDSSENLYIADFTNNAVRMINGPNNTTSGGVGAGFIHTIAGNCTSSSCTALATTPASGVAALGAAFDEPGSVVVDSSGNVYIGDNSDDTTGIPTIVRVIYAVGTNNSLANLINLEADTSSPVAGDVYTIAGNKAAGSSGEGAGLLATNSGVGFDRIEGLGLDSHGNLYIMDYGSHSELAEVNADTGILTYLSADGEPSSAAKYTAGDYCSTNTGSGSGPVALDEYGDGCPAPQSNSDNAQGNIGIDPSGNLYYADNGDSLVRKLTFNNSFPATTVGNTATTQNLAFMLETGSTGDSVSSVSPVSVTTQGISASSEFTYAGTGDSCSGSTTLSKGLSSTSSNTAGTVCIVPVIFKPAKAGARSGALQITGTISGSSQLLGTVYLNGVGNGAALAIDPGASSTLGSGSAPQGVATDSAGNVYVAYSGGTVYRTPNGGSTPVEIGFGLTTPHQVAIDGAGDLYVADSGTNEIVEFPAASTSSSANAGTAIVSGLTGASGVAVDASGNLYIAETGKVVVEPIGNGVQTELSTSFETPVAVAIDASGNVYVVDTGLNEIEKLTISDGVVTQQSTETLLSGAAPVSVAVDAAGDIYYGDSTLGQVVEVPVSGTTAAIVGPFTDPVGVALDPSGSLYVADSASSAGIGYFNRTAATLPAIPMERANDATLTNVGNASYSGGISSNSDSNASADFTFAAGSSNGCNSPTALTLAGGANCELAVTANTSTATDTVTFIGGSTLALSSQASEVVGTTTTLSIPTTSITYGGVVNGTVTVTPNSGSLNPTGTVTFSEGTPSTCTLASSTGNTSTCSFSLSNVNAGTSTLIASYGGDSNNGGSVSGGTTINVAQIPTTTTLSVTSSTSITEGSAFTGAVSVSPSAATGTVSLYLDGSATAATSCALSSGTCSWSLSGVAIGGHSLTATYSGNTDYATSSTAGSTSISVTAPPQAPAVATGDTRTVTEPAFPSICAALNAALTSVNDDIPASVDATNTNPDGVRIQSALNSCAGTGQAVELSIDGAGHNAYLTGPLSMPSGVTLLVDPGVYIYFSRNVQDYDTVQGTHTCGTVGSASATASCLPLIDIPGSSSNVGIMGFGKLDGRGGDTLINAFPSTYAGQSWWGLSSIANSGGTQENPRFIQIDTGASNITLYKITLRNSPLFHISTTGAASNFTAWDIKIVTPTSSRNTDGIDPGNAQNFTITRSWISDGDDNVAVGAAGTTAPAANISVTNNRFFAGHGESIGSYTQAGVSNILFDSNMSSGNGIAGSGSSINNTADSNSTGLRIKSGYDRGGLVTNIQYSNSCYQDHKAEIVFSPNYEATTGTASPNLTNILMQNLTFLTEGTAQFTGTSNNSTVYPLQVTLDNVSFPTTFPSSEFNPAPTNAALTYGPGQVSADFVADYGTFVGPNGNTVNNNITVSSLFPPACNFTYIAPELTGPSGLPQTIIEGQNATAVVILTPAVGGAAYPTGTVTLTDSLTSNTTTVTLPGTTDTISIPLAGLSVGMHTFTATYSGDSNYTLTAGQTAYSTTAPYVITVNSGSLGSTSTALSGVPSSTPFGTSFTASATITGSSPTGTVQFIVNGSVYVTAALASGTATVTLNLPYSTSSYSIYAVYSGDSANDGSTSPTSSTTVTAALTTTALSANSTTTTLGRPVVLTATVTSSVGTPTGTVTFSYPATGSSAPVPTTAILTGGVATAGVDLPVGADSVTATYAASGSFAGSASTPPLPIAVTVGTILPLPANPIALPYTMTTLAGGAASNCSASNDSYGDGCPATSIVFGGSVDLRSVDADPFGNVYLTDAVSSLVRRIAVNGVISNFAGRVTGTACVPTATTGCTPTLVSLDKPRGVSSDSLGNIYIAGYDSHEVFKVSVSTGLMYRVAGTGSAGSTGDGGAATSAEVNGPRGVWADAVGNIYIADTSNNKIRVVDIAGNIHTFAGTGTTASNGDGGPATSAAIDNPQGVMTDQNLNVYIADSAKVRVVCVTCGTGSPLDALLATLGVSSPQNGYIYTIAGGASSSYSGTYPTLATNVTMSPQKLAIDLSSNVYISDGNGVIWLVDSHSGNIRPIAGKQTANCSGETDSFGDGCPATQAVIGDGGNGIGVGTDTLGDIYISDTLNARIRKVITGLASNSTTTGSAATQPVELHFIPGDGAASSNAVAYSSLEWSLGTPGCTTNADSTTDCLLTSSFTPAVPGARSTPLTVNSSAGNTANLALTGTGLGAGATLDPASQTSFGTNLSVAGLATDNAGNVYVSDATSKNVLRFVPSVQAQGSSATATTLATLTAPGAVAVDPRGYVYAADTSTGLITQIAPTGAASTLPFTFTAPAGLAADALNNLYVSDSSAQAVYQLNPITGAEHTLAVGTLVAPAGLTIDPSGNLLITDPGAPAIYRYNLQSGVTTTVSSTAVKPSAIATDAAGNLLIADTASILAVPSSSNSASFTVASLAPSALAIDSAGNLYTGSSSSVLKLTRTQGYVQYAGASAAPQAVSLLESGNQPLQLASISQTDTTDYGLTASASTDCTLNGTVPSALATGGVCALTATYTPTTFTTTTDTATFNGNVANAALSTPSLVQLTLTGPAAPPTATIVLGAFSPASPVYGQSVTVSATVSGSSPAPAGTVVFTVDSSAISVSLVSGIATTTLTGLSVGSHTVSAAYTSSNGYASATTPTANLVVGQAPATVTLGNLSQTYTGSPLSATATTNPLGLAVNITYNNSPTPPTAAGNYTVVASVNNADYSGSASGTLMIAKATTSVAFTANPTSPTKGQSDILTATVSGAGQPSGTVVFTSGATMLCTATLNTSGVGSCSFVPSTDNSLTVTAQYQGDTNHQPSSTSTTLFVYDGAVKLQLSSTQLVYPGAADVTVCITPTSATGTVQIYDGTALLTTQNVQGGGCAYWYISPGLTAGTHILTAVYSGDKNNPSGTSLPVTVTVSPVPVTLSASCWNASFPYGANYQCTVNLSSNAGAAQGSITYTFDGASPVTVPLSNGNAQFTLTTPNVGTHTVVIAYAQQTNYAAAKSQTETFTVTPAPVNVSLTPSTWYTTVGTSITFQVAVSSWSAGPPNATGSVSFYNGATLLSTVRVNASGQASYTTSSLPAGSQTITATYAGGTNYSSGSSSVTITIVR
jgi:sugar lactone lactonase YvrE